MMIEVLCLNIMNLHLAKKAYDISSLAKVIVSSLYSNKYKKERNKLKNKLFSDYSIIDTIEQIKKTR